MPASEEDRSAVRALLGREPAAEFEVVVRDADGSPVVIRNAPFLDDGTPMPTRYWLVGPAEVVAVSRLEAAGGVREAEAAVPPEAIADAHRRYAAERDAEVPDDAPVRPTGGVGGTRQGVKCLHAHYAWHLAGGDDPVGRWVAERLAATLDIDVAPTLTTFHHAGRDHVIPVGPRTLLDHELADPDPPAPAQLTNALGIVTDHLDDVLREVPAISSVRDVRVLGDEPWHLAQVERGGDLPDLPGLPDETVPLERAAAEEVFRTLATERRAERLHNPGLDPGRVDTILGTCCLVLAVMRRLRLDRILVGATVAPAAVSG
jgi:hypothetical protein